MRCHKSIRFFFHKNRNERTFGCLFDETSPKEYSFLSFYQNKRFHVFIPKGSQQAPEEFSSLVKEDSEEKESYTNRLLQNFEASIFSFKFTLIGSMKDFQ